MGQRPCAVNGYFIFETRFVVHLLHVRWEFHAVVALYNTVCFLEFVLVVLQVFCCMSDQDLLFADFSDGSTEIEDGVEFNKVQKQLNHNKTI